MLTREQLRAVRKIQIRTNHLVSDLFAGQYQSVFKGRGYVTPQDVKSIGPDVLRHRVIVTYEAEAEEVDADEVVKRVFDGVPVP